MTASITVCSTKLLRSLFLWLSLLYAWPLFAAEVEVVDPQFVVTEEGYTVSANFNFELHARLEEAVTKGVPLYFVIDFDLLKSRWYWFDDKLASRSQTVRLSYHALTRQYRVTTGGLHQSFPSLGEALSRIARLRNWQVIDKPAERPLKSGESYKAMLRIRLDINQLPKPFQIAAVGSREWTLTSDWKSWEVLLPAEDKP